MTKHDLKEMMNLGAELGAAKAENDRLREVLSRIANLPMYQCSTENDYRLSAAKAMAVGALTHQADPTETTEAYTAVDMATAAAQGFRDGQAAVEQAPVQDEREAVERFSPTTSVPHCGRASEVEAYMTEDDDGEYMTVSQHERIVAALTRPAQTEQRPVRLPQRKNLDGLLDPASKRAGMAYNEALEDVELLNTPPIAQPAQQPEQSGKFAMHQRVRKTSGSEWHGRICGTYSTALTPEGYAVESEAHAGSVQIYPAKALEAVE